MDNRERWQRATPSGWRAFSPLTLLGVSTQAGLVLVDIVLWVVFGLGAEAFLSSFNVFTLSRDIALFTAIGLAQMVVLSMGEMNLAVGAIGGVAAIFAGWLMQALGVPVLPPALRAILFGGALGWYNGGLVVVTAI